MVCANRANVGKNTDFLCVQFIASVRPETDIVHEQDIAEFSSTAMPHRRVTCQVSPVCRFILIKRVSAPSKIQKRGTSCQVAVKCLLTDLPKWLLTRCCRLLYHKLLVAPFRTACDNSAKQYCSNKDAKHEDVHEHSPIQVHLCVLEWERERGGSRSRLACDEYGIHGWICKADKARRRGGRGGIRLG